MLQRVLMNWVDEVLSAAAPPQSGGGVTGSISRNSSQAGSNSKHKRNFSLPHIKSSSHHERETSKSISDLSTKEQQELFTGPRVAFLDEEVMLAPPPLPPKDDKYTQQLMSPSRMTPLSSPAKRQHHRHHQGRRSIDKGPAGTAVDIGLVWWVSDLHGKRI